MPMDNALQETNAMPWYQFKFNNKKLVYICLYPAPGSDGFAFWMMIAVTIVL